MSPAALSLSVVQWLVSLHGLGATFEDRCGVLDDVPDGCMPAYELRADGLYSGDVRVA